MKFKNTLIIGLATLTLISCNDFLDVDSPSSYNEDFVFSQETEISRALNGVYASILVGDLYGSAYQKTFNLNSDVDMQMYTGNVATHNSYARLIVTIKVAKLINIGELLIKLLKMLTVLSGV